MDLKLPGKGNLACPGLKAVLDDLNSFRVNTSLSKVHTLLFQPFLKHLPSIRLPLRRKTMGSVYLFVRRHALHNELILIFPH